MKYTVPAVIFAGGRSKRMGEDKALLPFGGFTTLAQYQYHRLQKLFEHVYIGTKNAKFDFDAPLIFDQNTESSPLVGLVSVFGSLHADEVFILSVDAPFITEEIIHTLLEADTAHFYDVITASHNGEVQPLCALYRRSILPAAQKALRKGNHKMKALLKQNRTLSVSFKNPDAFLNLNHPQEYKRALKLISS